MGVDETDIRILEQLNQDGRMSLRKIAQRLDLSPSTVSNRFHALTDGGVITGFRPIIDFEKVGLSLTAVIELRTEARLTEEVAAAVREKPKVVSFFEITGDTDIVIVCKFVDREDMNAFVKDIQKIEGIAATETNVVLTSPVLYEPISIPRLLGRRI